MIHLLLVLLISCHALYCDTTYCDTQKTGWAEQTLASLSVDEKIGQLFMVDAYCGKNDWVAPGRSLAIEQWYVEELITNYHIGGVLFLGSGLAKDQQQMTNWFQSLSRIPLLIAQDYEAGLQSRRQKDAIHYPFALGLGAVQDDQIIYDIAYEIGEQCKAIGVHVNFAPVVDINNNSDNPVIGYRSFGEDKHKVVAKARKFIAGLQDSGVIACIKHFPGHGDTDVDSHLDLPLIRHDLSRLQDVELYPYKQLLKEGVKAVMTAHLEVPALESEKRLPTGLSKNTVTGILRNQLEFDGLVFTDALFMKGVTKHFAAGEIELRALLAGNDVLLCPSDAPRAIATIKHALKEGYLTQQELDKHVLRILKAKEWVFNALNWKIQTSQDDFGFITRPEAQALKKESFKQLITVVGEVSDLNKGPVIAIQIGSASKNVFGKVLKPLAKDMYKFAAKPYMYEIDHMHEIDRVLAEIPQETTVVVGIFGMTRDPKSKFGIDDAVLYLFDQLCARKINTVGMLFGSPYALKYFKEGPAWIVGYENDPEGQAAALDVLWGKEKATGTLPVSFMPRTSDLPARKTENRSLRALCSRLWTYIAR